MSPFKEAFTSIYFQYFFLAHFLWADALTGQADELTTISSPLITNLDSLCFNFWFDVRQDAGIRYLQVETEIDDNDKTRELIWDFRPEHAGDTWDVGRVYIKRSAAYKIVITAQRSEKLLGYVAIDDFEFKYDGQECTTLPEIAIPPTPTAAPTTTQSLPTLPGCKFEEDTCGWFIDEFTPMQWVITNTKSLQDQEIEGPKSDFDGNFLFVNALKGNNTSKTILGSPFVENATVSACFKFRFNLKVANGSNV